MYQRGQRERSLSEGDIGTRTRRVEDSEQRALNWGNLKMKDIEKYCRTATSKLEKAEDERYRKTPTSKLRKPKEEMYTISLLTPVSVETACVIFLLLFNRTATSLYKLRTSVTRMRVNYKVTE